MKIKPSLKSNFNVSSLVLSNVETSSKLESSEIS